MSTSCSTACMPYGAYELKARYQRNLLLANLLLLTAVAISLLLAAALRLGSSQNVAPIGKKVFISTNFPVPPTIIKERILINRPAQSQQAARNVIPKPVPDDAAIDDDVALPTRDQLREVYSDSVMSISPGDSVVITNQSTEYLDEDKPFVHAEIPPQVVYLEPPVYPRFARSAGLTGSVKIEAIVEIDGSVKEAKVDSSSGVKAFDDAALEAAYKGKFTPGIQNGRPVRCPVAYTVSFNIDR
ncbi:MAG TPA: energy transducer TonB [Candidatus Acidoferrum sp.]|nr:energy transducer TonB [Candidatus Acidoferrum sp.]